MNIHLVRINSRISKMNKRRQKIALAKMPKTILTNAYPVSAPSTDISNGVFTMTFDFQFDKEQ